MKEPGNDRIFDIPKEAQAVLGRAIVDEEFRAFLFEHLDLVAEEYELTGRGIEVVKNFSKEEIDQLAAALDDKIIKAAAAIIFCMS